MSIQNLYAHSMYSMNICTVCMYVCMHLYMSIYMYECMHESRCMYAWGMYVCVVKYIMYHVSVYVNMYVG